MVHLDDSFFCDSTNLPSLPTVALEIVRLANDPEVDVADISRLVAQDPALASKILKFVNSPLYARQQKIASLRHAVVVLGLNATISLALSFSLLESLQRQHGQGIDYALFWRRALLAATSAKILGNAVGETASEELFLAGLLQDLGVLVIDKADKAFYCDLDEGQRDHSELVDYEVARLDGIDHAEVGARLLESWGLPYCTFHAVRGSHQTSDQFASELPARFTDCVALSGIAADLFLIEADPAAFEQYYSRAQTLLGLGREVADMILDQVTQAIPDVSSMFNMHIVDSAAPGEILERARQTLVRRSLEATLKVNQLERAAENLMAESVRDPLTGLYNRRYLDRQLEMHFRHAATDRGVLSVAFVDLDYFKRVNDSYGHQVGDEVLRATAGILEQCLRREDLVGRYGGEEFILMFNGIPQLDAINVCKRILATLRKTEHRVGDGERATITASIGLATQGDPSYFAKIGELISAADASVYQSKNSGRDRLTVFSG